jgi:WD40 repeat protein
MKLEGHHGEVWALAVAKNGSFIVSGSHDRSLRIWEKTDEQVRQSGNQDSACAHNDFSFIMDSFSWKKNGKRN